MLKKYKEQILYLFFGVLTTFINIGSYYIFYNVLHLSNMFSTCTALFLCISVAFITNKLWVFNSKTFDKKVFIYELLSFVLCRTLTSIIDIVIMHVCVDIWGFNGLFIKVLSNVIVIVLNYIASKVVIFVKK